MITAKKLWLINSSLLKESDCLYKVHLIHDRGFRQVEATWKMDYGTAVHKAIAAKYAGKSSQECIQLAMTYFLKSCTQDIGDWRTVEHLGKVVAAYFRMYEQDNFKPLTNSTGSIAVEQTFAIEWFQDEHNVVLLEGTIDAIGSLAGYGTIIKDIKSTSSRYQEKFFDGYELDPQMKFYSFCYREWCKRYVNNDPGYLPVVIDGVFIRPHKGIRGVWDGVSFERSFPITYTEEQMEEFKEWLQLRIMGIISGYKGRNFNKCKGDFGCMFEPGCRQKALSDRELWFQNHLEVREYNPLTQQD